MKEITSAIISSILKDLSSRRGKVVLISLAMAAFIIIVDLFWLRGKPSSSVIERAALSPLSLTDENGDKWTLDLVRGQPISRISESNKKPGPPLLVRTNVRKINNSQFSIGITVEGQAGEKYICGAMKNGNRQPEPQFVIVNERGRILARGNFEYG